MEELINSHITEEVDVPGDTKPKHGFDRLVVPPLREVFDNSGRLKGGRLNKIGCLITFWSEF